MQPADPSSLTHLLPAYLHTCSPANIPHVPILSPAHTFHLTTHSLPHILTYPYPYILPAQTSHLLVYLTSYLLAIRLPVCLLTNVSIPLSIRSLIHLPAFPCTYLIHFLTYIPVHLLAHLCSLSNLYLPTPLPASLTAYSIADLTFSAFVFACSPAPPLSYLSIGSPEHLH